MTTADRQHYGDWWEYMGRACRVLHGVSYECPALKLYGYPTDLALHRAVRRAVAKQVKASSGGEKR